MLVRSVTDGGKGGDVQGGRMPVSAKAEMARVRCGLVGEGVFLPGMRPLDQGSENIAGRSATSEVRGVRKGSLSKTVPLKTSLAKL